MHTTRRKQNTPPSVEPPVVTLQAVSAVPDLGIRAGDLVVIELEGPLQLTLARELPPDRQALLDALAAYELVPVNLARRAELDAYLVQQAPSPPRRVRYGRLQLVTAARAEREK